MDIKPINKGGGRWLIRVSAGYENGKKRMLKKTIYLNPAMTEGAQQKEAEKQTALLMAAYDAGKVVPGKRITLGELSILWKWDFLDRRNLSPRTLAGYDYLLRSRILPRLGDRAIQDIKPATLNAFYASLAKDGLSGTTQKQYHQVLNSMLTCAVRWQMLAVNPLMAVEPPKTDTQEITPYTDEQSLALLEALEGEENKWRLLVMLGLYAQLRRGEVVGLDWSSVDLDSGIISVVQNAVSVPGRGTVLGPPKTKTGRRTISIPSPVVKVFKAWRAEQNAERLKLGEIWQNSGAVFTQWNGERMHPDTPTQWFYKFLERNQLPHIRFHDLRHTGASLLISAGMDIETVKNRLGHAQASTTMNVYGHAYQKNDERAAQVLDNILTRKA